MITYPVMFEASAQSLSGMDKPWKITASNFESSCAVPVEFDGKGGTFSPEDFFMLALQNCFIATFKVFAHYSKLNYETLNVDAKLIVNKDPSGKPWMEAVHLNINLQGIEDERKAQLLINKTLDNGFILRSVQTKITTDIKINN